MGNSIRVEEDHKSSPKGKNPSPERFVVLSRNGEITDEEAESSSSGNMNKKENKNVHWHHKSLHACCSKPSSFDVSGFDPVGKQSKPSSSTAGNKSKDFHDHWYRNTSHDCCSKTNPPDVSGFVPAGKQSKPSSSAPENKSKSFHDHWYRNTSHCCCSEAGSLTDVSDATQMGHESTTDFGLDEVHRLSREMDQHHTARVRGFRQRHDPIQGHGMGVDQPKTLSRQRATHSGSKREAKRPQYESKAP